LEKKKSSAAKPQNPHCSYCTTPLASSLPLYSTN
jgi:hypothetical protein